MSNHCLLTKPTFLRAPLANGIGRYIGQLQRITFKYCKTHGSSRGIRDFLENDLLNFAKDNPGVVVYVKPRRFRTPVIVGEYLNGEKHWISIGRFEREEIVKWVELLRTQSKDGSQMRLRKIQHTEFPSVQGPWTPFTFRNPIENITKFPDPHITTRNNNKTATQTIIELYEAEKKLKSVNLSD